MVGGYMLVTGDPGAKQERRVPVSALWAVLRLSTRSVTGVRRQSYNTVDRAASPSYKRRFSLERYYT